MNTTRRLWLGLGALLVASFAVLLWMGRDMDRLAPPMPSRVVTQAGQVVYTREDIERGRALGATYLTKPFVASALLNAVERALAEANSAGW